MADLGEGGAMVSPVAPDSCSAFFESCEVTNNSSRSNPSPLLHHLPSYKIN